LRTVTRGRPRLNVDFDELKAMRARGLSFRRIARILGIASSTAFHLWRDGMTPRNGRKGVQKFPGGDEPLSPFPPKHHKRRGDLDACMMLLVQAIGTAFWNFLYRPPLMDCRVMRSCSRAISSNSSWCPSHRPHGTNLLHTTWPVSSRRTSYRIPSGFRVVRIMSYSVDQ